MTTCRNLMRCLCERIVFWWGQRVSKEYEEEDERMLTLEKFEQASEIVKDVTLPTKLVYSEYLSQQSGGGRIYLKPENMQKTGAYKSAGRLL